MEQHAQTMNYTYLPEKHTTIVNKPILIDDLNKNQRHTLKPGNNQQNQNIQNVQGHKPHTVIQNPNTYNLQNVMVEDKRKTVTHAPKKYEQYQEQIIGNEIIEETYYIDPHTGKKIIIPNINEPKANTYVYNTQIPQNDAYNKQVKLQAKAHHHHLNDNNKIINTHQPQKPQKPQEVNDNTYNINPTASVYNDIYSSITPSNEEKKSPIIENINPSVHLEDNQLNPKKSATLMTVNSLANIPYNEYPAAQFSKEAFCNISAFGSNSYNGKVKKYNEDRIKTIVNYQLNNNDNTKEKKNISYFAIFDGHSGKKCSDFLKQNLHTYLFNSSFFPNDPIRAIRESFKKAEDTFRDIAYDAKNNVLLDKSGSCALVMLIINDVLISINLGDSRALYSYDTGKYLLQITRDHKPNDDVEKKRIEGAGGKVYYANKVNRNGREIELKEEQFGKGFTFPYRVKPGKIAVSILLFSFLINFIL